MTLLLINDTDETLDEGFFQSWVKELSGELVKRGVLTAEQSRQELSVVFLKESDAKQLNWNFRQKDYATDVLSFETEDPASLGELVLCPLVLKRQAAEHNLSFEHETGYMILHGVLHLVGYDHEKDEEEAEVMMALQDAVFEVLTKPKKKAVKKAPAAAKTGKTPPAKRVSKSRAKRSPKSSL